MANASDQIDYCLWDGRKKYTDKPETVQKRGASYVQHKQPDSQRLELEKEEVVSSPRGILKSFIGDFGSPQSPELGAGCSTSTAVFPLRTIFKLLKKGSFERLASFPPFGMPKPPKGKCQSTRENPVLSNLYNLRSSLVDFSLTELRHATNNFSQENLIGKGGYSEVYKGRLRDGQLVAVKRLTKGSLDERTTNFLSELGIIAHVDHPNTAKLIGCGVEGGMHLVFQLTSMGSLASLLHDSDENRLDWDKRYKIALGIADGLLYLHESCQRRIIHRDIKAENVLLTENFEPQICDFGLAKWLPKNCTHHNVSKFEGTFGYFAPEYLMHGIVDEKTDVYAFGVLLLELITGRRALDHLQQSVVLWAKPLLDNNDVEKLADPGIGQNYDRKQMDRVVLTASLCVEQSPILRPRMRQIAVLLRDDDYAVESANCESRTLLRIFSEELLDAQEYNSTKHLSNPNALKQIAFDSSE